MTAGPANAEVKSLRHTSPTTTLTERVAQQKLEEFNAGILTNSDGQH